MNIRSNCIQLRSKGFSLIELVVVLVIIGSILATIPLLVPRISNFFTEKATMDNMVLVGQQLKGFAITHFRLPCPDISNDGLEDCEDAAQVGKVPYKTLNLTNAVTNTYGIPLQYAVYRKASSINRSDADLAVLKNRYSPVLPKGETSTYSNGLDFCWALRNAMQNTNSDAYPHVDINGPLNQAFILVDAGYLNVNNDVGGNFHDGINATGVGFEHPQKAITAIYNDRVYSVGFHQLSGEMGCHALMSHVNGAARDAFVAEDIYQLSSLYSDFRNLSLRVAEHNYFQATFALALLSVYELIITVQTGVDIVELLNSKTLSNYIIAGKGFASLGLASYALNDAVKGKDGAEAAVEQAKLFSDYATKAQEASKKFAEKKLLESKAADQNGWYQ